MLPAKFLALSLRKLREYFRRDLLKIDVLLFFFFPRWLFLLVFPGLPLGFALVSEILDRQMRRLRRI